MSEDPPIPRKSKKEVIYHPSTVPLNENLRDNDIPTEINVNGFQIPIDQISQFTENVRLYGEFDPHKLKIFIIPQTTQRQNKQVLFHESTHAIDFGFYPKFKMKENQVNELASDLLSAQEENNLCLNPDILPALSDEEIDNLDEKTCVYKDKEGNVKVKNCTMSIKGVDVGVKVVSPFDMYENSRFNENIPEIDIKDLPSDQLKVRGLIESFVEAVDSIEKLDLKDEKIDYMGQGYYQFLKDNPICFKKSDNRVIEDIPDTPIPKRKSNKH